MKTDRKLTVENVLIFSKAYTLFQNGRHFSILLFECKLALMASFSNARFKSLFNLERGHKDQFAWKQKNTKMAAILEQGVLAFPGASARRRPVPSRPKPNFTPSPPPPPSPQKKKKEHRESKWKTGSAGT